MLSREERKLLIQNAKVVNEVRKGNWYKKYCKETPYYLAIFAIDKDARGKGLCREVLEFLFEHAQKTNTSIVLETHTKGNVPIYEHFGFKLMETAESKNKMLTEYRMMKTFDTR